VRLDRARERLLAPPDRAFLAARGDALGGERQRPGVDRRDLRVRRAAAQSATTSAARATVVTARPFATGRSP
jgi:hypothetical protein